MGLAVLCDVDDDLLKQGMSRVEEVVGKEGSVEAKVTRLAEVEPASMRKVVGLVALLVEGEVEELKADACEVAGDRGGR